MNPGEERPFISVIVPAYNAVSTLGPCLEALQRQTVPPSFYEIIVVNDGSRDGTAALAGNHGVKLINQEHAGAPLARNRGAQEARGELLLFIDADCVPSHDWIERMLVPLQHEQIQGVAGALKTHQRSLMARFVQAEYEEKYARLSQHSYIDFVSAGCAAYKTSIFKKNGGFGSCYPGEDAELSFRLAESGYKLVFAPEATVYHRHPASLLGYLLRKLRYGYIRTKVYRKYPQKVVRDTYTPRVMPLQIVLSAALVLSLVLSPVVPQALAVAGVLLLAFLASTIPFATAAFRKDRILALAAPGLLLLRSLAQALGLALGMLALLTRRL